MKLRDLEEKLFIKNVLSKYADTANEEKFDDCILIDLGKITDFPNMPYLVYSIDHPSHIQKGLAEDEGFRFYGRWAAACTCGDVLAMGAKPQGFSLDLAAPLDTDVKTIEWILEGVMETLSYYEATYEGGNFDVNNLETVCMAWGIAPRDRIIRRSGAKPGDLIIATGNLGTGWSGYLASSLGFYNTLSENAKKEVSQYNIFPRAPYPAMQEVFDLGIITSGMDLTDGIVEFFYTISERNGLGVEIDLNQQIISSTKEEIAREIGVDPYAFSLDPGYDTPLTHGWTIPPEHWDTVKEIFNKHNFDLNCYGRVTEGNTVTLNGEEVPRFWDDQFKKTNIVERWMEFVKICKF